MAKPLVCLLREATSPDPYEQAMDAAGFQSLSVPTLRFAFVNQDALVDALAEPEAFAGLILTSPRSVKAVAHLWSQQAVGKAAWQAKPVFVVGPQTAEAVRALGLSPVGQETGSAEALAQHLAHQYFEAPLLFLCSSRRQDVLPQQLQAAGTNFTELCVYETHLRTNLEIPPPASIAWMVFYSPSGVEAVQQSGYDVRSIRKAAIGPTTAEALEEAGWQVDAIAEEPTPTALVAAIRKTTVRSEKA